MLSPYRVLDLTDERGLLCGQILADLGADVIAVEPPGGSSARRIGPFAGDEPDPERSLHWWAYARNKRGITLDLDTDDGREKLRQLVAGADFLIESAAPGEMAARGLGYDDLAAVNPALVYVSITPFGQDGPKAHYAATDLTVLAAGGVLVMQGDEDRPPVRVSVPQAWVHAGAEAAGAALIAHHERVRSGRGQHVDVSAQRAVLLATFSSPLFVPLGQLRKGTRSSGGERRGPLVFRSVFEARDGYVFITRTARLMEHIHAEGLCDTATRDKDWPGFPRRLDSGEDPPEELARVTSIIETFAKTRTKDELLRLALEHRLLIAPVAGIDELAASEQLAARDYWRPPDHVESPSALRHPGPFARFSATPIAYRRRAPALGEHDDEVLRELAPLPATRAAGARSDGAAGSPLAGVKVLDLMWVAAGPVATRVLADYGATVVRTESSRRIDVARGMAPMHGGQPGPENSGQYQNFNAGKLGLTLDLTSEAGRAVIQDLVRWADVVTESFSSKVMRAWGLDYVSLRKVKPDVIMLSSCLMGQSGPLSAYAGFGFMAAALAGFYGLTGWPDRAPAGPYLAYTDTIAPRFTVAAILAALDHRRRTGEGQYIDLSQLESSLHFLAPALLDYSVNGRVQTRDGNRDPQMAPHGVYPAAGDDRWVAIAVTDDAAWARLCDAIGREELAEDARYATLAGRLEHHDELDAIVSAWTRERDMSAAEAMLQAHGVAASAVQHSRELYDDAQLWHRGHFVQLEHEVHGTTWVEGSRFRLSRTPARIERAAPTFGRDNFYVLETILGYDADRIAELAAAGVLE
ncbi:MAG: CoA transferase [Chloroflexota bacterium]|nr:CoA transferase [Chloroflexota bacterium]